MKLNIYAYKSLIKSCYSQPKFVPYAKEDMITEVKRSLIGIDLKTADEVKDLILVYLGSYDDVSGKIDSSLEELLPLAPYIRLKEVSHEDGK